MIRSPKARFEHLLFRKGSCALRESAERFDVTTIKPHVNVKIFVPSFRADLHILSVRVACDTHLCIINWTKVLFSIKDKDRSGILLQHTLQKGARIWTSATDRSYANATTLAFVRKLV